MSDIANVFNTEPFDHEGHARCVIAKFPSVYKYTDQKGWLVYNGRYWTPDGASASVGRAIMETLRDRYAVAEAREYAAGMRASSGNQWVVNGVRGRLMEQAEIYADLGDFDNDGQLLNCRNGVVNLKTGELRPHRSSDKFTYCLGVDYKEDADLSEWYAFLDSLDLSDALRAYLQLVAGYVLTGSTEEECLFYLYGPSRSGKGTFTEVVQAVMGPLSQGLNFRTFTADRIGDTQNFDLAPLKNKRFIVASESRRHERLNEAVLKQVTGGDMIYCAHKGKQHFSYRPQFKIMLTSNHPANADPTDTAAWGRLRVIHFGKSFLGSEDKGLKDRLKQQKNLEGVLLWMVYGAMAWYESGLPIPDEVDEMTKQQKLMANSAAMFIDQCCTMEEDAFAAGTPLYNAYKEWCNEEGYTPYGRKSFTIALTDLGVETDRKMYEGKVTRGYAGLVYAGYGLGDEKVSKNGHVSKVYQR